MRLNVSHYTLIFIIIVWQIAEHGGYYILLVLLIFANITVNTYGTYIEERS